MSFTFPHHRWIPDWLFSKNTSLEFREVASAGTSMAFVLYGSEPWTWKNLIGGSGSEDPFLDVPPSKKKWQTVVTRIETLSTRTLPNKWLWRELYLKDDHFTLKHGQKVSWFFAHCYSDLNWLTTVLLIQVHSLKCWGCNFILCCMTTLNEGVK